jgi:hypothetical protein
MPAPLFSKYPNEFELTLYFYPSPWGMDWSSPQKLANCVLRNQFNFHGRSIGHVHVELKRPKNVCQDFPEHLITGMSQKNKTEERKLLLIDQIGLGILFHDLQGTLEDHEESFQDILKRYKIGSLSFLNFLISKESFIQVHRYIEEYKKLQCDEHYGLANRPLYQEGAGCTAFAASTLEVAGILLDEFKTNWTQNLLIPKKLIGGYYKNDEYFGENSKRGLKISQLSQDSSYNQKVSFFEILLKKNSWAKPHEPHREIFFWDPDLMHAWTTSITQNYYKIKDLKIISVTKRENVLGLILDYRNSKPLEKFWKI